LAEKNLVAEQNLLAEQNLAAEQNLTLRVHVVGSFVNHRVKKALVGYVEQLSWFFKG
jgi:hypothetical protein